MEKLINHLKLCYFIIAILNILICISSSAAVVLFCLLISSDVTTYNPYSGRNVNDCPEPSADVILSIEKYFIMSYFSAALSFFLLETRDKLVSQAKSTQIFIVKENLENSDEIEELTKLLSTNPAFKPVKFTTLAAVLTTTLTKLFSQCDTFVTPIEITSLLVSTACFLISMNTFVQFIQNVRLFYNWISSDFIKKDIYKEGQTSRQDVYQLISFFKFYSEKIPDFEYEACSIHFALNIFILIASLSVFGLIVPTYYEFRKIVINNFNETYCREHYYEDKFHYGYALFNTLALASSTFLFSLISAKKNALNHRTFHMLFKKLHSLGENVNTNVGENIELANRNSEEVKKNDKKFSDTIKKKIKELKKLTRDSDTEKYTYLINPFVIQTGIILAFSDDKIYKSCIRNTSLEVVILGLSSFLSLIVALYHLFKVLFVKYDNGFLRSIHNARKTNQV